MEIRNATINDYDIIMKLFGELDTCSIEQQPEHFQRGQRTKEYIADIINSDKSDFILCAVENEVIGFSLVFLKEVKGLSLLVPCKYVYIQDIVITESYRSKGYGKALLTASKQWGAGKKADYLRLSVIPKNKAGIRFYKSNGLLEQMITMECTIK